ncbi:MAG: sugar phosphate nucleotidyltransferase, partial [Gammaproteobacteria bacterium]
ADLIKSYFGNGEKWNIEICYSFEHTPLGTMGPLRLISELPPNFLVMNGDILTDLNFRALYQDHVQSSRLFTIASATREHVNDYGVLTTEGVYILNRRVIEQIPEDSVFGFDNLMLALLQKNQKIHVHRHTGYWLDIGRPDDYERAVEEIDYLKTRILND